MSDEMHDTTTTAPSGSGPTESGAAQAEERLLRRAERRAERRERRSDATPWLGGAILIVLGLIFMAQNLGIATLNNWWAVFILIPAVGAFTAAWRKYQAAGASLTSDALGSLIGGLVLTTVALAFLFNLWREASLLWPVLLIIGGVAVLLPALRK